MNNQMNVATLNCRGLKRKQDEESLANDMQSYKLDIIAVKETHLKGTGVKTIQTTDEKLKYDFFYTGSEDNIFHGVGIGISQDLKPQFKRISDRICMVTIKISEDIVQKTLTEKCVSSRHMRLQLKQSEKDTKVRQDFYDQLESTANTVSNRNIIII